MSNNEPKDDPKLKILDYVDAEPVEPDRSSQLFGSSFGRRQLLGSLPIWLAGGAAVGLGGCTTTGFDGPVSDHFDGTRFFNPWEASPSSFGRFLKWQFNREKAVWPEKVDNPVPDLPPERVSGGALRAGFIGHATVLLQTRDINLLTDPVLSERASPLSFAGPLRVRDPGLSLAQLPPIDLVTVSHNHYDHLDLQTLKMLVERDDPLIVTPLNNARIIKSGAPDARVIELDWWQSTKASSDLEVRAVPAQHWSSRTGFDRNTALWSAFVIETKDGPIYVAGDTGLGPHFEPEQKRYGGFRLSLLPIGAYEPRWFMKYQHMNPADAVQAHSILQSDRTLGVHFGTFQLTDEPIDAPVIALQQALGDEAVAVQRFRTLEPGASWTLL